MENVPQEYLRSLQRFHVVNYRHFCVGRIVCRGGVFHPPLVGAEIGYNRREYEGRVRNFVVDSRSFHLVRDSSHHRG